MRNPMTTVIAACLVVTASFAQVPAKASLLTQAQIQAAIDCGMRKLKCDAPMLAPGALSVNGPLVLKVIPPIGRIYLAARDAKEKYLAFTASDVSDAMLAATLEIRAIYDEGMAQNTAVQHIVLLPRGSKDNAVQPASITEWNFEKKNLAGATLTQVGRIAQFNIAELPSGEIDVVIIAESGREKRWAIKKSDREKLDRWITQGKGSMK
jgi:hypothetical protein